MMGPVEFFGVLGQYLLAWLRFVVACFIEAFLDEEAMATSLVLSLFLVILVFAALVGPAV